MARLLGPDAGSRLVYAVAGTHLQPAVGDTTVVYSDADGTTLADIATYQPDNPSTPGGTISGSTLVVDANSMIPLFWFPDGVDTVWVRVSDGPLTKVNADYDARLDSGTGGGTGTSDVLGVLYNVETFGAVGDGTTDDFPAVQAAWNAMMASTTPGRVFFPRAAVYRCVVTDAVVAGADGQYAALPLPARATDNTHPKLSYGILGVGEAYSTREYPGSGSTTAKNTTSSVILVDYTGSFSWSGTDGHPSFIGAPDADFGGNFTNLHFTVDHITMRQPDNPSLCGINLETCVTARVEDFCADLNVALDTTSEPTHPTGVPLLMPKPGNAVNGKIEKYLAWGYYAGLPIGEHCDADSIETIACKIGGFFRRSTFAHAAQIRWWSMEECPWGLAGYDPSQPAGVTNNGAVVACPNWVIQILFWDVEDFDRTNTAPWMYPGAVNDTKAHVYDPNNALKGWCHYMRVDSGAEAGDFETAYVTGGLNFGMYQLASRDTAVTRLQGGNPTLITYASDTFTRADSSSTLGTTSGGQAWSAVVGTWGIKSNQGYCAADGAAYNIAVLDAVNSLITYTIDVTPQTQPFDFGMVALCADAGNLVFWDISGDGFNDPTNIDTTLFKKTGGGSFTAISPAGTKITMHSGTRYRLKMVVGANVISCYLDDTLVLSSTGGATGLESNTKFGMASAAGSSDRLSVWDNLLITSS